MLAPRPDPGTVIIGGLVDARLASTLMQVGGRLIGGSGDDHRLARESIGTEAHGGRVGDVGLDGRWAWAVGDWAGGR